jgi:hypothetical protein
MAADATSLWIGTGGSTILRVNPSTPTPTILLTVPLPALREAWYMAVGPDGSLWYTGGDADVIGRVRGGVATEVTLDQLGVQSCYPTICEPEGLVVWADGRISFALSDVSRVGTSDGAPWRRLHIVASRPALSGLTDADLAVFDDELFTSWASGFVPFAIDRAGTGFTAPDATTGAPYILIRDATP